LKEKCYWIIYSIIYSYTFSYPDAENADLDEELSDLPETLGLCIKVIGKVIGHRILVRYYKQKLSNSEMIKSSDEQKLYKSMMQYRTLDEPITEAERNERRIRDIRYLQKIQTRYLTQL
jgi:hypothetical protein